MAGENHTADTLVCDSGEPLKSIETVDGKVRVGSYAIRFADKIEKDLTGDYFTKATDFGPRDGDGVVALFEHGLPLLKSLSGEPFDDRTAEIMKSVADMQFGTVKTTKDDIGIFAETILDTSDKYSAAIAKMCEAGKLKWSSSTGIQILRKSADGEITRWHPIEFSFTAKPAEPRLPAIAPLKSIDVVDPDVVKAFAKSTDFSVEDIREQVRNAAAGDARFTASGADSDGCSFGVWVADLISHDNSWTAVIQAVDGKYYEVGVTIAGNKVSLAAEAKEVTRKTEYAPVEKSIRRVDSPTQPTSPTTTTITMTDADKQARALETAEMKSVGTHFKCVDVAEDFIHLGKSLADLRTHIAENVLKSRPVVTSPEVGMSRKETKAYSILKALRELANGGQVSGLEKEASDATAKQIGKVAKGFFIPHDIATVSIGESQDLGVQAMKSLAEAIKTLNQTTFSQGGALIGTNLLTGSMIDLLRNKPLVSQMGARSLSGLVGNIAIPAQTGGATAYWLSESGTAQNSDQAFAQLGLTPKRLVGRTGYTKELMNQTDISVEAFVRDDITTVLALAKDLAAINGTGGSQPLGILNTNGRATDVTFGGAATRAKMIEFQANVAALNASRGALGYLTTPTVAAKMMNIPETQYSTKFVWDGTVDSGMVVGRRAEATNQVPGNKVIYGNFSDLMLADWAGIDVVVNPYTNDAQGVVTITITLWTDSGIRHSVSFCVSTDSGAQ